MITNCRIIILKDNKPTLLPNQTDLNRLTIGDYGQAYYCEWRRDRDESNLYGKLFQKSKNRYIWVMMNNVAGTLLADECSTIEKAIELVLNRGYKVMQISFTSELERTFNNHL